MVLPVANDVLGVAKKMLGFDRILLNCQDGHERLWRIRGRMKRRAWVRLGDIIWRYKRNQAEGLRRNAYLKIQWNFSLFMMY